MILIIPEKEYRPDLSIIALREFSETEVREAVEELRNEGVVVRIREQTNRRIPGRGIQISDKYVSLDKGSNVYLLGSSVLSKDRFIHVFFLRRSLGKPN